MKTSAPSPSSEYSIKADGFFLAFFKGQQDNACYRNTVKLYPAKAVILKQGAPANAVYLIEHGLVKFVTETQEEGYEIIIDLRYSGWLIGAPTIFLNKPYNFKVIAVVPTLLHYISKKDFLDYMEKNEQFSWHVCQLLSKQIVDQMKKIEAMRCLSTETRLLSLIADMIREMEASESSMLDSFTLPLTNKELAQLLVVTPEHLCRVLKKIEQKGLVRHGKGSRIVTDPSGLIQSVAA